MVEKNKLDKDLQGTPVDATLYRGMIGSLMYLTSSRPDLIYAVCLCAQYQARPTKKHLHTVKQIFRYLKGTINMGIWYSKDTGDKLVSWPSKKQKSTVISSTEAEYFALSVCFAARDEQWVPSVERVKISSTNIILETTIPLKEETLQVVIDMIKNSICLKAFTISADVLEIFMQQFWYTIKKVKYSDFYEFLLANKKCIVNAEVFRIILDICPRVEGVDFTDVPNDDTTLTFLINLGYKGLLNRYTNMFVDHMHQPWRTLAAIFNKFLYGKTMSNNKIKKSRIDIQFHLRKAKRKTSSKRRVKKKVTLSDDDNIISDDPDAVLELAKSISQTKAEKAEAARKVHDTHAKIVTESVSESAKKKSSGKSAKIVVIHETPSTPKSKPETSKAKLKGVLSLTPEEQEAADIIQALKEKYLAGVPDDDTVIIEEKVLLEWGDEDDDDDVDKDDKDGDTDDKGDDQDADDEDEEIDDDDIYKYKICVRKDEDKEMKDAEDEESDKGNEEATDAVKEKPVKSSEAKDDAWKTKIPPSSLSFIFLVIPETTVLPPIPELVTENPVSTIVSSSQVTPITSFVQQTTTPIHTPPTTTDAPTIVTTISGSNALIVVELRVAKLEKDVSEIKIELQKYTTDLIHKYSLQHLPELTKKPTPTVEQESKKSPSDILKIKKEQAEKQKIPKYTIKSTDKAAL
ncbi:hypothetical protein Tco_0491626 [Tanacetum coccineum]